MAIVSLQNGLICFVDDQDLALVSGYSWYAKANQCTHFGTCYAATRERGTRRMLYMHRLIVGAKAGQQVDHRNHNGLDNRRENLRICTKAENAAYMRYPLGRSGYRGVVQQNAIFCAHITIAGRYVHLGTAKTAEAAALLYDAAARQHFGEFAKLNFPREPEPVTQELVSCTPNTAHPLPRVSSSSGVLARAGP